MTAVGAARHSSSRSATVSANELLGVRTAVSTVVARSHGILARPAATWGSPFRCRPSRIRCGYTPTVLLAKDRRAVQRTREEERSRVP